MFRTEVAPFPYGLQPCSTVTKAEEQGMKRPFLYLALMLTAVSLAASQESAVKRLDGSTIRAVEIDGTVARLMKAAEVTGAGIAIFNDGKITYLKAYGFRDKEKNLPLTVDSVMSAASFSKVAFAFLVMELVDDGVLDLESRSTNICPSRCRNIRSMRTWRMMHATSASRRGCC
jgi:CubicO group peptidase (beta-lactamase class C family)